MTESFGFSILRRIKLAGLDYRYVVIGACDSAIAASDTNVVLKIDLAFRSSFDRARRATVYALGIVAMAAGGRDQVFSELDSSPYKTAFAMKRLACLYAVVALDA